MAAALGIAPDALVITGGLAHSKVLVDWIVERVSFLAKVMVYPGEEEMGALAAGVLRVLRGEEQPRRYGESVLSPSPPWERVGVRAQSDGGDQDRASG